MNIEEYRAMVKAQAEAKDSQKEQPEAKPPEVTTPPEPQTPPEPTTPEVPSTPTKVTIEGIGEVDLDELKAGYLRTQDYTKKTQEVARSREEVKDAVTLFETIKSNPQLAEVLKNSIDVPKTVDPSTSQQANLEQQFYDLKLELEIRDLQAKYPDFEVMDVLNTATNEKITNLESAYLLSKARKGTAQPQETKPVDLEVERERIRRELLQEFQNERASTSTMISSNDVTVPVQTEQPKITPAEQKVARMFGWTDEQFIQARDNKR